MSKADTPTDNAAMEPINDWIKAEMFTNLHVTSTENIEHEIADYIVFFNEERPAYSLNYLPPKNSIGSIMPVKGCVKKSIYFSLTGTIIHLNLPNFRKKLYYVTNFIIFKMLFKNL